jgi:hypothetical protein
MTTTLSQDIAGNIITAFGPSFQILVNIKQIVILDDGDFSGVVIDFAKGSQGINKVVIEGNDTDSYDMHFWRVTSKACKEITAAGDIQASELGWVFENITGFLVHF